MHTCLERAEIITGHPPDPSITNGHLLYEQSPGMRKSPLTIPIMKISVRKKTILTYCMLTALPGTH